MIKKKPITYGDIFKRQACITSIPKSIDITKNYTNLMHQLENANSEKIIKEDININLNSLLDNLADSNNATAFFESPIELISKFNSIDVSTANYILNRYTKTIMNYSEKTTVLDETVERYDLTQDQKESILLAAANINAADRILNNHYTISKRFNIEEKFKDIKSLGLKGITEKVCGMIDTYNVEPYKKMNLCIEEMTYLLGKNGVEYNKKDFVEYVTEYFLLNYPAINSSDIKGYKIALTKNYCLDESDIESVSYIWDDDNTNNTLSISNSIKNFLKLQDKTLEQFEASIMEPISDNNTLLDISYNLDKLLFFIWDVYKAELFDSEDIINVMNNWCKALKDKLDRYINNIDICSVSREFVKSILSKIYEVITSIKTSNPDSILYTSFIDQLEAFAADIDIYKEISYTKYNLECLSFVNNPNVDSEFITEGKLFRSKPRTLLRAVYNLDKYLKDKCSQAREKVKQGAKKVGDFIWGKEDDEEDVQNESLISQDEFYSYIGSDNKFDKILMRSMINESSDAIHDVLTTLCRDLNTQLESYNLSSARCYYIINGNIAEIHLKESCYFKTSTDDELTKLNNLSLDEDFYIEYLSSVFNHCSFLDKNTIDSINTKLISQASNCDSEKFNTIIEALSLTNIDKKIVSVFCENYSKYRYSIINEAIYNKENKQIQSLLENWNSESASQYPYYVQLEAYAILDALLEADNNKKNNKDNNSEKEDKKNPFKGINLNSIKLYLQGLKSKFKHMSQKEKEVSRKIDDGFKVLVKSMKNALITDRREAIIKGSVIPSFSKCMKIGIALAGIAKFANPAAAAITAIGGFAVSKKLTKKERALMLDEIDIELEVVEKEISNAESNGNMKKYRQLLQYKKSLQREYQRIRYNITAGTDYLTNSEIGVKKFN